jgi:hypothetical protein
MCVHISSLCSGPGLVPLRGCRSAIIRTQIRTFAWRCPLDRTQNETNVPSQKFVAPCGERSGELQIRDTANFITRQYYQECC